MLLNNGWLNERTLLILDEPEIHLHPLWIVRLVEFLIALNEKLGVRILITSHSFALVDALRTLVNGKEIEKDVRYCLAEERKDTLHTYEHKELDKEGFFKIFKSFNQYLDEISSDNEEE